MTGGKLITRLIAPVLAVTVLLAGWQFSSRGEPLETTVSEEVLAADTLIPEAQQRERIVLAQSNTASTSSRFQLGTHYQRLSPTQPTSSSPDQIEVAERHGWTIRAIGKVNHGAEFRVRIPSHV